VGYARDDAFVSRPLPPKAGLTSVCAVVPNSLGMDYTIPTLTAAGIPTTTNGGGFMPFGNQQYSQNFDFAALEQTMQNLNLTLTGLKERLASDSRLRFEAPNWGAV
jgi:hypothetical protein